MRYLRATIVWVLNHNLWLLAVKITTNNTNTNLNMTIIIQSAIEGTFDWSGVNSMILNTEKTVMNTNISHNISPNCDFLVNDVTLTSSRISWCHYQ